MDLKLNLKNITPKKVYNRFGNECYLDAFRQMLVPITPETLLLFKMEMYVHQIMGVPKNRMYINQSIRKYGHDSTKVISIIIHDLIEGSLKPVALVDCTAPGVHTSFAATSHLEEFAKSMNINYLIVTNGDDVDSYISRTDRNSYWKIDNVPNYETICAGHRAVLEEIANNPPPAPAPVVVPGKAVAKPKVPSKPQKRKLTTGVLAPQAAHAVANLSSALLDSTHKIKAQSFNSLQLVGDCGNRKKLLGFGSEKAENPLLRTFLVKDFYGNHQLMSLDVDLYASPAPTLNVTLDHFETRQVVLSLDLNVHLACDENACGVTYDLREAAATETEAFLTGLKDLVIQRVPHLLKDDCIHFGSVEAHDAPSNLENQSTADLALNLITLALIIDEQRETIKRTPRTARATRKKTQ